jgi:hypothetical protein
MGQASGGARFIDELLLEPVSVSGGQARIEGL